jgi:hypothetical protein
VVPPFQAGLIFCDGPLAHEKITEVGSAWRERQDGIETIQGLNGGLLIDAKHSRVLHLSCAI